ncbi:helicase HerA domain-containing protein [Halomicrobium sp. LC1Hm]|uniref:helicase HerA domain-containing protein n=1 Tax=Halomicrobium sp. LC1Hm TaxID=2610902 RepID=UPI0012985466|nr:DUF87 domain-containing protein [Halomicrobium sp. LC1Hm]QGA82772.1 HerA helicase [Halomicrobium sp. LC1Hm]
MAETEHITVATTSAGVGGTDEPGRSVDLPVVELLTGRGFVTGKSGSGKSNTASVIAEKLLDNGFGLLIVDIDGEYYGLKEEYEILHVGGDEECDIQVTVEHAEKIASLALEQNVPIILDISSFLDQEEAEDLLTEVARHLFAKAKKQKQPFLMLVEECHEWIPEKGSVNEVGQMLIKIGKRGRKHGLGMVGISQRPADVKKDYITQCDWLVWHRLTWNNDTKVVGRIIDSEYADAVEDLDNGEAFLMTDWAETIRRVQFHRKQTFDAGATPGLDDFERPELKSVSDDLVSELETISEEKEQTQGRIKDLREELDKKNSRIAELEKELQDARDMTRMAEQFTEALLDHVEGYNPGRTQKEKERTRQAQLRGAIEDGEGADDGEEVADESSEAESSEGESTDDQSAGSDGPDGEPTDESEPASAADEPADSADESADSSDEPADTPDEGAVAPDTDEPAPDGTSGGGFGDAFGSFADGGPAISGGGERAGADGAGEATTADGSTDATDDAGDEPDGLDLDFEPAASGNADGGAEVAFADATAEEDESADADDRRESSTDEGPHSQPRFVVDLRTELEEMDEKTRRMLQYYVEQGADTPLNAHFSAGGSGDRTSAYAHNRELRLAGFVEHVGRGRYAPRLKALVRERAPDEPSATDVVDAVTELRSTIGTA